MLSHLGIHHLHQRYIHMGILEYIYHINIYTIYIYIYILTDLPFKKDIFALEENFHIGELVIFVAPSLIRVQPQIHHEISTCSIANCRHPRCCTSCGHRCVVPANASCSSIERPEWTLSA